MLSKPPSGVTIRLVDVPFPPRTFSSPIPPDSTGLSQKSSTKTLDPFKEIGTKIYNSCCRVRSAISYMFQEHNFINKKTIPGVGVEGT